MLMTIKRHYKEKKKTFFSLYFLEKKNITDEKVHNKH